MKGRLAVGAAMLAALTGTWAVAQSVTAQSPEKSKKTALAGSTTKVMGPQTKTLLLSELIRTSKYTDLLLSVTAECSITTELQTIGTTMQEASGEVLIWIEIDGKPVSVTDPDGTYLTPTAGDDGKIAFCNRTERRETDFQNDQDHAIRTFMETRQASGFNWGALNVGKDPKVHKVEVFGTLSQSEETQDSNALAVVGKRTLIIEPVKAAKDELVNEIDADGT